MDIIVSDLEWLLKVYWCYLRGTRWELQQEEECKNFNIIIFLPSPHSGFKNWNNLNKTLAQTLHLYIF